MSLEIYTTLPNACSTLRVEVKNLKRISYQNMKLDFDKFVQSLFDAVPDEYCSALDLIKESVDFDVPDVDAPSSDSKKPKLFSLIINGKYIFDCVIVYKNDTPFFSSEEIRGINKSWKPFGLFIKDYSYENDGVQYYTYHISLLPKTLLHIEKSEE